MKEILTVDEDYGSHHKKHPPREVAIRLQRPGGDELTTGYYEGGDVATARDVSNRALGGSRTDANSVPATNTIRRFA